MDALFDRFHNFILPFVRGEDGVCACTCGRHRAHHVVPYDGTAVSDIMTRQEMNVIVGLLLGFCISLFLQWLDRVWHSRLKYWRENQTDDVSFWSWMPKFSNTRELLHPHHTEDSGGNMLHLNQDAYNNVDDT